MNNKQILITGKQIPNKLKKQIKGDNPKKIFLVTGKKSYFNSKSNDFIESIINDFSFIRFYDFSENPKIEDVKRGIELFKKNNCDYVISIGGGSVLDMAKLINIGCANESDFSYLVNNCSKIKRKGKKLIAIPTTSGSGSEATHFAVLYVNEKKYSISHPEYMLPDVVVLAPSLTYTNSKKQTAISGVDAFSQAVESFWSNNSTIESRRYSTKAIKIILKYLPKAVNQNCVISREKLLFGSYFAGCAINIAKTTGAHALSYTLTSKYQIQHGQAVILTLIEWFEFNSHANDKNVSDKRGLKYVKNIMLRLKMLISGTKVTAFTIQTLLNFMKSIDISTTLNDFEIRHEELEIIVNNVNIERLDNNPVFVNKNDLLMLLKNSIERS